MLSSEHKLFLKKRKKEKRIILISQVLIVFFLLFIWQVLADFKLINTFIFSSPKNIINTLIKLQDNNLFGHIFITMYETIVSFLIASLLGIVIGAILWRYKLLAKILDPYLTVLNSLPKVALGPLIIIWVGTSTNSIIFMALLISSIISIINIYNSFIMTDKSYITLLKSFGASEREIFFKVVIPSNITNIISTFKINISMSLIGVVMGELLVSKKGLGYLIMYASQVFNINLVLTSVFILGILSFVLYYLIHILEKKFIKKRGY